MVIGGHANQLYDFTQKNLVFLSLECKRWQMRFVPYEELDGVPNVIVDGAGGASTVLTLSHWPGSRTTPELQADLSAEIVVRYLEHPALHVDADAVSNNHFDEDGLMGVFALVAPDIALAHKDLLVDTARAGDFGWSHSRDAARTSFAISTLVDPEVSPLDPSVFQGDYPRVAARLYQELLPRVPELLDDIGLFESLWAAEDAHLTASDAAVCDGRVTITEQPDLDLAVVTVHELLDERAMHRFTQRRAAGLHPMSVHNRTEMTRIAYVSGHNYEVQLRYETWVQLVSRTPLPRVDLALLGRRLDQVETAGASWQFDGAGVITPSLTLRDARESSIEPDEFLAELFSFLPTAPAAWDPWSPRST